MKKVLLSISILFSLVNSLSQNFEERNNKGRINLSYGINRTSYDLSNIKLQSSDYNFELTHFDADDNYFKVDFSKFNAKIGFFITNNISLSLGYDNFTYKNIENRAVKIDGTIDSGDYSGTYKANRDQAITKKEFITFEYTKLSYLNFHCEINDDFWSSNNGKLAWSYYFGIGGGALFTESKASLFGADSTVSNNGLSGFGIDANFGTRLYVGPLFFDLGGRVGYMKTKDIATDAKDGKASQGFMFSSIIPSVGFSYKF